MAKKKELPDVDQPWTSNYPPLEAWLKEHGHSCMWQARTNGYAPDASMVEAWLTKPPALSIVIVVVHAKRRGWDLYTGSNTNNIAETLADAERRACGAPAPTLRDAFLGGVSTMFSGSELGRDEREKMFETWLESTKKKD